MKLWAPDRIISDRCTSFRGGIEGYFGGTSGWKFISENHIAPAVIVTIYSVIVIPTEFRIAIAYSVVIFLMEMLVLNDNIRKQADSNNVSTILSSRANRNQNSVMFKGVDVEITEFLYGNRNF